MFNKKSDDFDFSNIVNTPADFSVPAIEKVRSIVTNPLAQYDPFFVGRTVHALARTSKMYPDEARIDVLNDILSNGNPAVSGWREAQIELEELCSLRATLYREALIVLGVSMGEPYSLDYNSSFTSSYYRNMLAMATLYFPQDWLDISNSVTPRLSVRGNKYARPEYDVRTGKGKINATIADIGDFVSVLAMRIYLADEGIRGEIDRLVRSSGDHLSHLSPVDFFVSAMCEMVYGRVGNRRSPMVEGYQTYFILWLMSRHSTLIVEE